MNAAVPRAERPASAFALGDALPKRVLAPRTFGELAEALRAADRAGDAAVVFGGGTLQDTAALPSRYDLAISTGALDRTLAHEFKDLTIAVEAGQTLSAFARALAEHGQFVPLDAPRSVHGTVGGALASGWLGPRRAAFGRPRDFLIGTTVALADGTLASAGGMVVKNVTGYDLSRLYVGSHGTLAAIARANFKTLPLPPARRFAVGPLPEGTRARAIAHVRALRPEPSLIVAIGGFEDEIDGRSGTDGRIAVLYEGSRTVVDTAMRALRSALGAAGVPETSLHDDVDGRLQHIVDAYVARLGDRSTIYRSFGDPDTVLARDAKLEHLAARAELHYESICDGLTGDVIARVSRSLTAEFAGPALGFDRAVASALARVRLQAAPPSLRGQLLPYGAEPPALKTMLALKRRFDPSGTLAPDRLYRGL